MTKAWTIKIVIVEQIHCTLNQPFMTMTSSLSLLNNAIIPHYIMIMCLHSTQANDEVAK